MDIARHPTPHAEPGRRGHRPKAIVIHTTVGTLDQALNWFADPSGGVSAHYVVALDGRVVQLVEESDTARHAGRVLRPTWQLLDVDDPDLITVGIDFEDGGDPDVDRPASQYAAGAELVRAIADRWNIPLDRDHVIGHREIFADETCPGSVDIDRLLDFARDAKASPLVVCLLPVRNGERDLPAFLDSVRGYCDAIVALDDGSTDRTAEILEADDLVRILLRNPPRASYAGWHDGENRTRLLEAARQLMPTWIISVDADERIDEEDASALRAFLAADALPGCAYGLQHFRMWGDDLFEPDFKWVYRLFAYAPDASFPDDQLHFNPVPTTIARDAWVRTSIRIRHHGSSSPALVRARLDKYREADPQRRYRTDFAGLDREPIDLAVWPRRPASMPVLVSPGDPWQRQRDTWVGLGEHRREDGRRPRLLVLVPARNATGDLPGFFESVSRFADGVVALDDGSTDGTLDALRASPLVERIVCNPRRDTYAGWDDAANRSRLLEASAELEPDWVLFLDADERLDEADGAALRAFIDTEATPGFAYMFRVCRMVIDEHHYDRDDLSVARLFAFRPDQRLPSERLHFVPVPTEIPRSKWLRTTLRIQHLASVTAEHRRARREKYREADPDDAFQTYDHLLEGEARVLTWEPRAPDLPVLMVAPDPTPEDDLDLDGPVLSAIVISQNDEARIERTVASVVSQRCPEPFEVIVVTSGTDRTAEIVRERFPDVTLIALPEPALPGAARNAGMRVARGDWVTFPGSHVELPPGSLASRLRAHEHGYPMVTGTTLNGTNTPAGWASYFLDHTTVLPGRPSGRLNGPPAHCSYMREAVLEVGGFPEDMRAGEDTVVNRALFRRGYRAYRDRDVVIVHHSRCATIPYLLRHHFGRGRAMGRILLDDHSARRVLNRRVVDRFLKRYVRERLRRTAINVRAWAGPDLERRYRRVRVLVAAGAVAAWLGIWYEILRPAPGKLRALTGLRLDRTLVIAGLDRKQGRLGGRADVLMLARLDPRSRRVRLVSLPRDLRVDIPGRGVGRINGAYQLGALADRADPDAGSRLLQATVEKALGVRTHGSIVVDFSGFTSIVDALGGIDVDVPYPIDDDFVGEDGERFVAHFAAGTARLDGATALIFARTRHADGDEARRHRHLDIVRSVTAAVAASRSPSTLLRVAMAARRAVRVRLTPGAVIACARVLVGLRPHRLDAVSVEAPVVRSVHAGDGRWYTTGDGAQLRSFVRSALEGAR